MFKHVAHIGIAVKNLDEAIAFYRDTLQLTITERKKVEDQGVEIAFVELADGSVLELLAPLNEGSPLAKSIARRGTGLHHICLEVDDIDAALAKLTADGITMVDKKPRIGAEGRRIAFIHPKSAFGTLIELQETD